jgi:putative methyltransferase (TIGR04325 family)
MALKRMVRQIVPPVFVQWARRLRTGLNPPVEWEYIPEGWAYAERHPEVRGWDVQEVLETYQQKWPRFVAMVQGTGPLAVAHESLLTTNDDLKSHNTIMTFGYALALAASGKTRLSMLDWGGGIGHYFLLARALLPGVEIAYRCKDLPLLCAHGAQLFPQQQFSADESCFEQTYDFVIASTSVHYARDWRDLVRRLAGSTSRYLYVANVPSVRNAASFVFVQRPYRYGYNTEYLGWCINRTEFLDAAAGAGLALVREFVYGHEPVIRGAPEQNGYRGYLFRSGAVGRHATGN